MTAFSQSKILRPVALLLRIALGGIFVYAAWSKLKDPWALFAMAIDNGRSALDGAVAIYIDNLATGTRYTDAVIQAQFQRIKEELERKPVLGKSLVTRATLFVRHVGDYRQQRRADPAAILKELLASNAQRS